MLGDTAVHFFIYIYLCLFVGEVRFQNKVLRTIAATTGLHALCLAMTNCFCGAAVRACIAFLLCVRPHFSI